MSKLLLDRAIELVRSQFSRAELATVQAYGGEFSAQEIDKLSFNAPAVLITVLGWSQYQADTKSRMATRRARDCKLAAFVVTKHAKRELRMQQAMLIAEKLALVLRSWNPATSALPADAMEMAALSEEPTCENLYGRAVDAQGLALWLVSWQQAVSPVLGDGDGFDGQQLANWLTLELESTAREVPLPAPAPAPLPPALVNKPVVTQAVGFGPNS
jgi:phage gp37-like protein